MDFETQALEGIKKIGTRVDEVATEAKAVRTKQDELVSNFTQLDKDTKKAFEDLTTLKKTANESVDSFAKFERKIIEIQARMRWEQRAAFGNPIKRIQENEELRMRFNLAVRLAVDHGGDMRKLCAPQLKALGEDASPGSLLINDALSQEIYDTLASYGIWNTFAVRRVGTKTTKLNVKTARVIAQYILTEGGTIADDTTKAGTQVSATIEVIAALLNVSLQLLQDAESDVTADILDDFGEAFAFRMDWSALQADGTADADDGGMTGVFAGGTAAAAAAGNLTTETTDFEDWTRCLLTVDPVVLNRMARWWLHPQHLVRMLSVKDLNGRPIFLTALEAPTRGGIGSILGYPVTPAFAAPTANAANAKVAVFGDPNGQVVAVGKDFTFEASDHHKWNTLERSFRGYGRSANKIRRALAFAVLTLPAA